LTQRLAVSAAVVIFKCDPVIGKREGVGKRYVSRMVRLAFLSPTMIERIAEGRQPSENSPRSFCRPVAAIFR
jgi:hypothetical protein